MEQRQWPILALFCLLHVLVFTLVFTSGAPDVEGYYRYATRITEGQIPYRDFSLEYPPGALMVFFLPLIVLVDSRQIIWALFIITAGLTYYIYPMHYDELMDMQSRLVIITRRQALAFNPLPAIIPCHRVIMSEA